MQNMKRYRAGFYLDYVGCKVNLGDTVYVYNDSFISTMWDVKFCRQF